MIYLFYTGAEQPLTEQHDAYKSLGGYISISQIPNGAENSIFGNESQSQKQSNKNEIVCIAVKNVASVDLTNFTFYVENISTDYEIYAAFVSPSEDECQNLLFEKIKPYQIPYYATFENVTGVSNMVTIATFVKNTYLGLFLQKRKTTQFMPNNTCEAIDFQSEVIGDFLEDINLQFGWD